MQISKKSYSSDLFNSDAPKIIENETQNTIINHPKVLINLIIINKTCDKMLVIKRKKPYWELIGKVLEFGETYDKALENLIKSFTVLDYNKDTTKRLKYIASLNALNKGKSKHFVEINFLFKLCEEKENEVIGEKKNKINEFEWMDFEKMEKEKEKFFFGINIFFEKFNIKKYEDIENIHGV